MNPRCVLTCHFSVATTSTKPPSAIKQDIKRVLDRMQIQYRETKTGFECIHAPSIDINSVVETSPSRGHRKQPSVGSADTETTRKSIARKSSKLSFGKKSREREKTQESSVKEKELPSRPSGGTGLSMTPSSASSSFFHVSSNAHGTADAARSDLLEAAAGEDHSARSSSPTTSKILPPIPRDFVPTPQPGQQLPAGPVDNDVFESIGSNSLSVRFDINIVKVGRGVLVDPYRY